MIERGDPRFDIGPTQSESDRFALAKKREERTANVGCSVLLAGAAGVLALAGYGAFRLADDRKEVPKDNFAYRLNGDDPLKRLEELIKFPENNPPSPEVVKQYLINNYYLGRIGLDAFSDFELKTGDSDEIKKTIGDKRIKLAFLGADILAKEEPDKNIVTDEKNGVVIFEGRYFDIKNPRHLFILDEIIEQNFYLLDTNKTPQEKYKASKWLEDLNWLADSKVPVQFEVKEIGYPPEGSLRALARFYRTLDRQGIKKLPEKIIYLPYLIDENYGYAGGIYRDEVQEIEISKSSGADSVPHEDGHYQSFRNVDYSQDIYNKIITEAKIRTTNVYDEKDTFINPDVLKGGGGGVEVEDYAETIRVYFWDGVAFRRRIQELKYAHSDAAIILEVKYEFAKKFFKGEEFTKEGEVFDPKIGDVFEISDSDPQKAPIPLRQEPMQFAVFSDSVFDKNPVKVLDGPIVTIYRGDEVRMWKVEAGDIFREGEFDPRAEMKQGWISETWFGDRFLAKESEEFKSK